MLPAYFSGCLVGALVGDCLGAPFEFESRSKAIQDIKKFLENVESLEGGSLNYTDDTAMTRSVANSLIENEGFDANNLAKKFAETYYADFTYRRYGKNVISTFCDLYDKKYGDDVFQSAREQFDGSGSHGNGGAMRVAPVALFSLFNLDQLTKIAKESAQITHANKLGYNGAILQCFAVQQALMLARECRSADVSFVDNLLRKMSAVEA